MLTVGIVTYNNEHTISLTLESLKKQRISINLIVLDNGSVDNTLNIVRDKFSKTLIIQNQINNGFAGGNNQIINHFLKGKSDYLLLINPDCVLNKLVLNYLQNAAKQYQNIGIFGPKIYAENKTLWSAGGRIDQKRFSADLMDFGKKDYEISQIKACEFISGTCMFIPKEVLNKGLRFYEPYFMYYEDVEFCLQAVKQHIFSYLVPKASAIHYETSKNKEFSKIKNYYLARNHLLFVERNAPFAVQLRELVRLPKTLFEHYKLHDTFAFKGITDYYLRRFGKQ